MTPDRTATSHAWFRTRKPFRATTSGGPKIVLLTAVCLFLVHLVFTLVVRVYVVPFLTPATHWRYGLQVSSDSKVFHEEAERLAWRMRLQGWQVLQEEQLEGMSHTKILASIYHVAGRAWPFWAYLFAGVLFSISGTLMYAVLRQLRVRPKSAALASVLVSCGPMYLFSHSELLREPFVITSFLMFVLGELILLRRWDGHTARSALARWAAGAVLMSAGLIACGTFRPYLLLLMTGALVLTVLCRFTAPLVFRQLEPVDVKQLAISVSTVILLIVAYVVPTSQRVQQYSDKSVGSDGPGGQMAVVIGADGSRVLVDTGLWKRNAESKKDTELTRADFMQPHWCTVQWSLSPWVPRRVDAKLESIACARQDYLRFCDRQVYGTRADRHCHEANFYSAAGAISLAPAAAAFALLVPLPRMWLDGFGSGGTGLRRAGYVLDGVVAYVLLAGLVVLVWRERYRRPEFLPIALGIVAMLTLYGLAVPTQFVLARLRIAMFTPLLVLGAAGWLLLLQDRQGGRERQP